MTRKTPQQHRKELFLPDFCGIQILFSTLVVGELLALVLTLDPTSSTHGGWQELALISLFIQWVALGSIACLCLLRGVLERIGNIPAAVVSYGLILVITLIVSEVTYRYFLPNMQLGDAQLNWLFDADPRGLSDPRAMTPDYPNHLEFLLRALAIGAIAGALSLRYFYIRHQARLRLESESQARIQALQSRIRPHFLFNSMNTIASLARSAPELAEQVTEDLADLFRVSLGDARVSTRLGQELELCRQYLRIEGHRLGARLRTSFEVEGVPENARLPGLTLQPLLENAIYHGIEPATEGGEVCIEASIEGQQICIYISNSLPPERRPADREGNQMALDNVRQRLEAFFQGHASLQADEVGAGYKVSMRFPYQTDVGGEA